MDMSHEEMIQRLCDGGEESIRQSYPDPTDPRRRGGMLGFKIVRAIKDPAEFPATLERRAAVEAEMTAEGVDEETYRAHRWATLQVEFVWEILKSSLKIFPESAANALRRASVVGGEEGTVAEPEIGPAVVAQRQRPAASEPRDSQHGRSVFKEEMQPRRHGDTEARPTKTDLSRRHEDTKEKAK